MFIYINNVLNIGRIIKKQVFYTSSVYHYLFTMSEFNVQVQENTQHLSHGGKCLYSFIQVTEQCKVVWQPVASVIIRQ